MDRWETIPLNMFQIGKSQQGFGRRFLPILKTATCLGKQQIKRACVAQFGALKIERNTERAMVRQFYPATVAPQKRRSLRRVDSEKPTKKANFLVF